jgi:LPXTG-site transpeptidase (sortase) family protein
MKHKKKSGRIFAEKINGTILRQTLRAYWPVCALALVLVIACTLALSQLGRDSERYTLETAGNEIDFANPEIKVHTADDGIAVVVPDKPETKRPAKAIADPVEIWQGDIAPTHGGFTLPVAMDGDSIGVLTIPDIGLSARVYEGEDEMELMEKGVALFRHTSAWTGNIGLSAHNVNFDGSPGYFLNLYKLKQGDVIIYETALGTREYVVDSITEISEMDWSPLDRTDDNRLTLITCIRGKPELRLCVVAKARHP